MKKKYVFIALLLIIIITLAYRFTFCYRVIALSNSGDLKYKEGKITFFPTPPLSIVNPFKEKVILEKIENYCKSKEFDKYYESNNYETIKYINFFDIKERVLEGSIEIKSIKDEANNMLVLVSDKTNKDIELVFIIDCSSSEVIGYY